jgi:hypothetical protein
MIVQIKILLLNKHLYNNSKNKTGLNISILFVKHFLFVFFHRYINLWLIVNGEKKIRWTSMNSRIRKDINRNEKEKCLILLLIIIMLLLHVMKFENKNKRYLPWITVATSTDGSIIPACWECWGNSSPNRSAKNIIKYWCLMKKQKRRRRKILCW